MRSNVSRLSLRLAVLFFALAGVSRGADGWARLKVGMTRAETTAVLGNALFANEARGFAVHIYDGQAEVVFVRGRVASWTAPAGSEVLAPPLVAWQQFPPSVRANGASGPRREVVAPRADKPRRGPMLPAYRL